MCAREVLEGLDGPIVVLAGDTPLLRAETLSEMLAAREAAGAAVCVLTARMAEPSGYGRIVRDGQSVRAIVEQKDLTTEQEGIDEVNTGTYCFDAAALLERLDHLDTDNAQGEYYLTDAVEILVNNGFLAKAFIGKPEEGLGVNSVDQIAVVEALLRRRWSD
jgi:bifunctional UDP-N-acetylglucosamine pyrophosphorylase/glucosamine-1-phosphate N-acetyltransferase